MKKLRLAALAAFLAAWPGVARADSPIMEFIEGWSGPGPFFVNHTGADVRVVCFPDSSAVMDSTFERYFLNCWRDDTKRAKHRLWINANTATTNQLFADDPTDMRTVRQTTWAILYSYAVSEVVQVGGGIEFVHLTTKNPAATTPEPEYGIKRTGFPVRVTITPFGKADWGKAQRWTRLLQVSIETAYFNGTLDASDFGNTTSKYKSSKEFQGRAVIAYDLGPFINWKWPHRP